MRKSMIIVFSLLFLAALVPPAMAAETKMKPVTLRVSSAFPPPETSLASKHLVVWEEMVTEKTNGAITFKNYWGASLGKPPEHLTLVQTGAVDLVISSGLYTPTKLPLEGMEYVFPFGTTNHFIITQTCRKIYEEFPQVKNDLAKYNCTRVFQSPGTNFVFLSKNLISKLEDFKGLKCAVIGRYFGRWIGAIGAVAVAAPGHERYTMLQTGVVDASFNPVDLAYTFKDIEQGPYCLDPELLVTNWISCWINLNTLKKFPEDVQKLLLDLGKETEIRAAKEINPAWTEKIYRDWKSTKGFVYSKLSDADREKWAERVEDVPAEWAAEITKMGYPGWEIVKRFQEISEGLGHKWIRKWGLKK
jgi:TRAP-type transport system periplasmic protein